ncbi:MAG: hypothetical protein NT033_05450 [Candidatus Omnitrophica bacterium]|nr:hypothetical protein [Candidatus Omnitrophota bacterium]
MNTLGIHDWDQHMFYLALPVKVISEYSQLPLWNPWSYGGIVLFEHPEDSFLSPFTSLYFLFDTPVAVRMSIFLHLVIGMAGITAIARRLFGLRSITLTLAAGALFAGNGFLALQITSGHMWILTCAYIPWVFYFFERFAADACKKHLIAGTLILAIMLVETGIYTGPYTYLFLLIYAVIQTVIYRRRSYLKAFSWFVALSMGFAAVKIFPALDYLSHYPRLTGNSEMIPLSAFPAIFTGKLQSFQQAYGTWWQIHGWHEYGCYLGSILAAIVIVSIFVNLLGTPKEKMTRPLLLTGVLFLGLMLGNYHHLAPQTLLHRLPVFNSMHMPGRFLLILTFLMSLSLCAFFVSVERRGEAINNKILRTTALLLFIALLSWGITDMATMNMRNFTQAFSVPAQALPPRASLHEYSYIDRLPDFKNSNSALFLALKSNIATIAAYETIPPKQGFQQGKPLVWSAEPKAKITHIIFTPRIMRFDLETPVQTQIILNQNYVRGWKFHGSKNEVKEYKNEPSVVLPAGKYKGAYFYYFPSIILLFLLLTIITIIISIYLPPVIFKKEANIINY